MPGSDIRVKAGAQRQLVQIMQPMPGPIGAAGATTTLQLFAGPLFAEISPASARDLMRSGQAVAQTAVPITIRYQPGMETKIRANMIVQRMQSKQGQYYVTSSYIVQGLLNVDERNWKLTMMCLALGANQ